jgi:hypothetical protein
VSIARRANAAALRCARAGQVSFARRANAAPSLVPIHRSPPLPLGRRRVSRVTRHSCVKNMYTRLRLLGSIYMHIYVYIYMYIYVYMVGPLLALCERLTLERTQFSQGWVGGVKPDGAYYLLARRTGRSRGSIANRRTPPSERGGGWRCPAATRHSLPPP